MVFLKIVNYINSITSCSVFVLILKILIFLLVGL